MFCWVVPCFTGHPCPIPIKCPHSAPWSPRQSELPLPSRCPLRSRTTSGYKPLEGSVSCTVDSLPDCGLPQSTDGSRRQGKMQKLKHRSAFHHIPKGWRVPAEKRWPWRSHPSQWEHGRAGGGRSRGGEQGRHRSSLQETELRLQPNQSDQLGQSPLVLAASVA